jgi:hypothetical protein
MKKLILSGLVLMSAAANAIVVTKSGTFEGSISNGQVHGKCKPSSNTCWSYDTDTRLLTIQLFVLPNAEMPIENSDGTWTATYEE